MPAEEYHEDDVHEYVDKSMATEDKEAHDQLLIIELLKPILQNSEKYHIETYMEQEVTFDNEALKMN